MTMTVWMASYMLAFVLLSSSAVKFATALERFDLMALTDFQHASHRLQETTSRLVGRKHSIPGDEFGTAIAALGDIDGDGKWEFAVSAPNSDVGCGAIHVLRIQADADAELLATNILLPNSTHSSCGSAVSLVGHRWLGKQHMDRHILLAAGAPDFEAAGAVLLTLLTKEGSTKSNVRILQAPALSKHARFGASVTYADDIDGDGNNDLVIGAPGESSIYVALLDRTGGPFSYSKSDRTPARQDGFGTSLASLGDIDDDGRAEFLVASKDNLYLLRFARNGVSRNILRLALPGRLLKNLARGSSMAFVGLDDDDNVLFSVGTRFDDDGGREKGAVWIIVMQANGVVKSCEKLSATAGRFSGKLDEREHFGASLSAALDINGDGFVELLIGAPRPPKAAMSNTGEATIEHERRGGIWVADIPGTRTKKVTKLALRDTFEDCVYDKNACTCAYRSGQKAKCLSLARITASGALCHERYCVDSFACGEFRSKLCRMKS